MSSPVQSALDIAARQAAPVDRLLAAAGAAGGWGYSPGKSSRIEPTALALLALRSSGISTSAIEPHAAWLRDRQNPGGWLAEDPRLPVNVAFNALAAFLWIRHPDLGNQETIGRLLEALTATKGSKAVQSDLVAQDGSLQGWPWTDGAFSWVEPTAWGVLALKAAARSGIAPTGSAERVAEGERVLINRACRSGGWNYGNAAVFGRDLAAYVPVTALVLVALQDRRDVPAVSLGFEYLKAHWQDEQSGTALALSLLALHLHGHPVAELHSQLAALLPDVTTFGNTPAVALSSLALSSDSPSDVFRL